MTQHTEILFADPGYTRTDYTALRAFVRHVPLAAIAERYYSDDSPQRKHGLKPFLLAMREHVASRACVHQASLGALSAQLRQGAALTATELDQLIHAAGMASASPQPGDPVARWLRPRTAAALHQEGILSLADLLSLIKRRGAGWWRPLPRIGAGRAAAILAWLDGHADSLGAVSTAVLVVAAAPALVLDPAIPARFASLGRFTVSPQLDGSQGINRSGHFCFIQARDDLTAVEFYLARFDDQPHTFRAYRKELERLLLWAILVAGKPLSSLLVDDCEAYKRFLAAPSPAFRGERAPRQSERWRPFSLEPMTARSQKQAVLIIRGAFDYLVRVRYLGGNPWVAVLDPKVAEQVHVMQIEKALGDDLWLTVVEQLARRAALPASGQERTALAAILLLGDSGLRREEAAGARRVDLQPSQWVPNVWTLRVLGKRNKWREVPVSSRTVDALRVHWADRGVDFDTPPLPGDSVRPGLALLAPLVVPRHDAAIARHEETAGNGYTGDGLYRLIRTALSQLKSDLLRAGISPGDFAQLETTTPHAFRHTFGTLSVAHGMPQDVVQGVLGHASGSTTSIYVRAKDKRTAEEAAKYFAQAGNARRLP